MLYLISTFKNRTFRRITALLILSLFVLASQSQTDAQVLNEQAEIYRAQGYEKQQSGRLDEALTFYLKSISLGNETPVVNNDLGVTYEQLGLIDKAIESYLKAIQLDENYLPPYTNLAYLYEYKGDIAEAIMYLRERYRRAKSDDPWKARIYQELQRLDPSFNQTLIQQELERKQAEISQEQEEQLRLDVIRFQNHFKRGQEFLAQKNYDQALVEFDRALVLAPNNPKVLKAKEKVAEEQKLDYLRKLSQEAAQKVSEGDLESAKKIYQEMLSDLPEESDLKSEK